MSRLRSNPVRTFSRAALAALALACAAAWPAAALEGEVGWSQFQGDAGHGGVLADGPAPPYRQLWRFSPPSGVLSGAVIVGQQAIAVGDEGVYAVDLTTGALSWKVARDGGPLSMPAVGSTGAQQVLVFLEGPAAEGTGGVSPSATSGTPSASATASPSAGGGVTEVSSLVAVDLADRKELWRIPLEGVSRSGVTIDGDRVFVADVEGKVYAVDLASGAVSWTAEALGRVESPPAVAGGFVNVVSRDPDNQQAQILALDEETGEKAWDYLTRPGAAAASAASAADGMVVVGAADRLVRALSAKDGAVRWQSLTLTLFSPVNGPSFQPGNVVIADASGGLYRIDPSDGSRDWQHQLNQLVVRSSPVVSGGSVLVGVNDGRLVALDLENGDLIWESAPSPGLIGSIALSREMVVAVKGGKEAGLVAYAHDPSGTLVRIPSPTTVDPAALLGNFALALVVVAVVVYVPFRLLRPRLAPAFAEGSEPGVETDEDLDDRGWDDSGRDGDAEGPAEDGGRGRERP